MRASERANVEQFSRVAASYDNRLAQRFFRPTHDALLREIDVHGKRVLDVGCGTGVLAARLGERGSRAIGVDVARAMVAAARAKGVDGVVASATSLPFRDGAFDVAVTTNSLHHWPDVGDGIREMARVVGKGGLVVAEDLSAEGFVNRILDALARAFEEAHLRFLQTEELARFLREANLEDVRVVLRRAPLAVNVWVATGRKR